MKIYKTVALLMVLDQALAQTSKSLKYLNTGCVDCPADGGRQCLESYSFTRGYCCDPEDETSKVCRKQMDWQYCSTPEIKNPILRSFVCPADDNCPTKYVDYRDVIDKTDWWFQKAFDFDTTVPTAKSANWNCKMKIVTKSSLISNQSPSRRGYIFIQIEMLGFDDDVHLILQPVKKFYDYSKSDSKGITKIYKVDFSRKFYIPAEYEILIAFSPTTAKDGKTSPKGRLRMRYKKISSYMDNDSVDPKVIRICRSNDKYCEQFKNDGSEFTDGGSYAIDFAAKEERDLKEQLEKEAKENEEKKDEQKEGEDAKEDDKKTDNKVDWDGTIIDNEWFKREIKFFDYNLTYGQITAGYLAFVIIVVIVSIIVSICIYRNRETVKVHAVRLSQAIRASIAGRRVHDLPEDPEEQNKKMKDAVNQEKGKRKEFLGDLMDHHQNAKEVDNHVTAKSKSILVSKANAIEADDSKGRAKTVQEQNNRESIETNIKPEDQQQKQNASKLAFVEDGDVTSNQVLDKNVVFDENVEDGTVFGESQPRQSLYKSGYSKFYRDLQLKEQQSRPRGFSKIQALLEQFDEEDEEDSPLKNYKSVVEAEDIQRQKTLQDAENLEFLKLVNISKNMLNDLRDVEENKVDQATQALKKIEHENDDCEVMSVHSFKSNDEDYQNFQQRKNTIMKTMDAISKKKEQDPEKQKEIMASVVQALEEEEETYVEYRKSMKKID